MPTGALIKNGDAMKAPALGDRLLDGFRWEHWEHGSEIWSGGFTTE